MQIVIVSEFGNINGGAAKVAITSAAGLAERGIEVLFVCAIPPIDPLLCHPRIEVRCFEQESVWTQRNPLKAAASNIWNRDAVRMLSAVLATVDRRETVVHFHQWTKAFGPSVFAAVADCGIPAVVSMHDYFLACPNGAYFNFPRNAPCSLKPLSSSCIASNCDSRSYSHKVVRIVRQAVTSRILEHMPRPLNVINVSEFSRQVIAPFLPRHSRTFVVPNPAELPKKPPIDVGRNDDYVFVGRFTREKGCVEFAQAARDAGVQAVFLGDGPEEAAIRRANPAARLLPWGTAEAVEAVLARARALVFPSLWYETAGLVAAEALSKGVPVISSRQTGIASWVEDGENGCLYDPAAPGQLEQCMLRLRDGDAAERMGRAAYRAYWKAPLSLQVHVDRLVQVYRVILEEAGRSG